MKKRAISFALVLALMLSLLPLAAFADFTTPTLSQVSKQLQGTYAANGASLIDINTGRKAAATVLVYGDSITVKSEGKTLSAPLVRAKNNDLTFVLDNNTAVTLEFRNGKGVLFAIGNGIALAGDVKKVSSCLPVMLGCTIVKKTVSFVTCAALTTVKLAANVTRNFLNTTGCILRSLLEKRGSSSGDEPDAETGGKTYQYVGEITINDFSTGEHYTDKFEGRPDQLGIYITEFWGRADNHSGTGIGALLFKYEKLPTDDGNTYVKYFGSSRSVSLKAVLDFLEENPTGLKLVE